MKTLPLLFLTSVLAGVTAQDPKPATPAAQNPKGDTWSEGFARATSYRSALAQAIEDAVAKVQGIQVARGPSIRSRLSVVTEHKDGDQQGWFDGQAENEREWVQQQIAGFVLKHEVTKKEKVKDGMWEVSVRALVAGYDHLDSALVIELVDNDLRKWQHERYEEDGPGRPFAREAGAFAGPKIGEYLRKSGAVKVVSGGKGVSVGAGSAVREREKAGQQLVASHRVVIQWQPLVVKSMVEKPNKARPSAGPRPEFMSDGVVQVAVRIEDLVENTVLLEQSFVVPADGAAAYSADRLAAFVNKLVDKAKAVVATKVFFTLRKPVILRKWAGDGGAWFVEARIARRVAAGFRKFSVGNDGSLANPDWQTFATAKLVGGSATSCTFELLDVGDAAAIEAEVSEIRPLVQ